MTAKKTATQPQLSAALLVASISLSALIAASAAAGYEIGKSKPPEIVTVTKEVPTVITEKIPEPYEVKVYYRSRLRLPNHPTATVRPLPMLSVCSNSCRSIAGSIRLPRTNKKPWAAFSVLAAARSSRRLRARCNSHLRSAAVAYRSSMARRASPGYNRVAGTNAIGSDTQEDGVTLLRRAIAFAAGAGSTGLVIQGAPTSTWSFRLAPSPACRAGTLARAGPLTDSRAARQFGRTRVPIAYPAWRSIPDPAGM